MYLGDSVETQKTKLTAKAIDKLSYSKQQTKSGAWPKEIWWDTEVTGFGLRVYPTGKKSYIIEYRVNRKKRLKTIGEHGLLTLEQARSRAKKDLTGLLDNIDPMSTRDQARESGTFAELASIYMERYAKPHKKTWRNDAGMLSTHLLPKFGKTPAISVSNTDLARLHLEVGRSHPYAANRFVKLMSVIYHKGIQWGVLPKSLENPAHNIEYFKEEKRDRYVKPEEMPTLMESIDLESSIYVRNAIWMYLLTGLRKTELLTAKWEYLDIQRQELRLPDTKSDRAHYLPLSNDAIQLLNTTPRLEGNPYIFPGKNPGAHLVQCHFFIVGYRCFNLMRASSVVKRQLICALLSLRWSVQAATSCLSVFWSGIRRSRH